MKYLTLINTVGAEVPRVRQLPGMVVMQSRLLRKTRRQMHKFRTSVCNLFQLMACCQNTRELILLLPLKKDDSSSNYSLTNPSRVV